MTWIVIWIRDRVYDQRPRRELMIKKTLLRGNDERLWWETILKDLV